MPSQWKSGTSMARAAGLLVVAMALSRVLGYVRDIVIYFWFGQNNVTDAYNAAFSIPDTLYLLLVGGALSSAFIPVFSSYLARKERNEAWEVASTVTTAVLLLLGAGVALGLIFTRSLMQLLTPGFSDATLDLAVGMTRVMFIQVFFMALSGIASGILNSYQHFSTPALGSILYNLGIILVGIVLEPYVGITGFAVGVVLGSVANFGVQVPALLRLGVYYRPSLNLGHPGVKRIAALILPVLIGLSVSQLNLFVNQNLASTLAPGIVSALRMAQRLMQLPIGVFAVAVAVAVFPTMTSQAARGENLAFKRSMSLGVRSVIFITLPSAAGLVALREPLVRLLFEQGRFTAEATALTAEALLFYSLGIVGYSVILVLNRVFYALQDTRTPVAVGVLTVILNILLNILLVGPLRQDGLALAYSLAGNFNMLLLLFFLRLRLRHVGGRELLVSFTLSTLASLLVGVGAQAMSAHFEAVLDMSGKLNQFIQVITSVLVGAAIYAVTALALRMEEATMVWDTICRRLQRRQPSS